MSHLRISRTLLIAALAAALLLILPAPASARVGVGIGFYGGYYGPIYPYGYYGPYGYPYAYGPYGYAGRPLGEVKIKSPDSNAQIFINGALAGRAHDLKRFYLVPGGYNIEQHIGSDVQKRRIYVIANRSVQLEFGKPGTPSPQPAAQPDARPAPQSAPPAPPAPLATPEAAPTPQPVPPSATTNPSPDPQANPVPAN